MFSLILDLLSSNWILSVIQYAKSKVRFLLIIWSIVRVKNGFPFLSENAETKNCTILCMKNMPVPEQCCPLAFPLEHPHKASRFLTIVTKFNTDLFVEE